MEGEGGAAGQARWQVATEEGVVVGLEDDRGYRDKARSKAAVGGTCHDICATWRKSWLLWWVQRTVAGDGVAARQRRRVRVSREGGRDGREGPWREKAGDAEHTNRGELDDDLS